MKRIDAFDGKSVYHDAKRMARYGRSDWIVWTDRSGIQHARRASVESIKAALLSVGTQGHFSEIHGGCGSSTIHGWRTGINRLHWEIHSKPLL